MPNRWWFWPVVPFAWFLVVMGVVALTLCEFDSLDDFLSTCECAWIAAIQLIVHGAGDVTK